MLTHLGRSSTLRRVPHASERAAAQRNFIGETLEEATPESAPAESSIDVMLYVHAVWRRKWIVLAVAAVITAAVTLYTARQPKVYSATTSLIIDVTAPRFLDNQVQEVVDNGGSSNYWFNKEYYETQHNVITSRAVSSRVVDKLGLQSDAGFLGLERMPAGPARDELMRNFDAPSLLQGRIRVTPVKESRVVNITVEDGDPQRAALLANEVAEAYMLENLALKLRVTETASKWLEDRLTDLEGRAKKSELAVYDFKKDQDVLTTSLEDRANVVSQRLTTYNTALTDVRTRIAGLRARVDAIGELKKLNSDNGGHWAEALPWVDSSFIKDLKLRFANQRTECAELSERYLEAHPKLAICKEKLALAEKDLLRELNNAVRAAQTELAEATAKESNLVKLLDQTKGEAFVVNKKQIEYERLKRDADNDQRLYDLVLKRLKDIELSGLLRTSNVRILDAARPSFGPVRPNVNRMMMMALAMGLMIGVALVLLLEFGDQRLRTQGEVEALGMPFLGLIPALPPEVEASERRDLHVHDQPKSMMAESCRAVRTNLLFMSPDKPIRTMVVTSSSPQEGKSMSVLCLGTTIAQSGKRVLLLDTDMRRPRLHRAFGVPNDVGVSSLVVGEATLDQAVKTTEVPNLFLLPCGPIPPNPSELLHTRAFQDLLEAAKQKFDWIILDSPPINAVTDAVVLATLTDGVVLVVKAALTPRNLAAQAVRSLQDVNAKVFGAILNGVDFNDPKFGGYYTAYQRYGYYYGEKTDEAA